MVIGLLEEDFVRAVREQIARREQHIASGKLADFAEYKAECGKVAGLKDALGLFKDVVKRHGELDDGE